MWLPSTSWISSSIMSPFLKYTNHIIPQTFALVISSAWNVLLQCNYSPSSDLYSNVTISRVLPKKVFKNSIPLTFQVELVVKNLPANAGDIRDAGLIPGLGRNPGGESLGTATESSILVWRIPMDRGAQWVAVHRVGKNWIWLKWFNAHTCTSYPALFFLIVLTILWATGIFIYILPSSPLEYMFHVGVGGQDFVFFTQCYIFRRVTRYKVDTQKLLFE